MSGLGSTLSIAKSAIAAQQYGLAVTGNNIANVNNPNYSLQSADQINKTSALYAGFLFGTGVDTSQIEQSVDSFLENRLTDEKSTQAAYEEAESYMNILEGYFDENSDASITSIMIEFWNSWHDLSDNPLGSSERVAVYEKGLNFANRLNKANSDLAAMALDINQEIYASLEQVNSYSRQIADLNQEIVGLETTHSANDLRDQRNALLDAMGTLIDIDTFEQGNGSIIVNLTNGSSLVNGKDHYTLSGKDGQVYWQGSYGSNLDLTDKISGGKIAGWLEMRDEILPKFSNELDVLAKEMIWAMNDQHSQGAGLEYFTGSITGSYEADQSGLLSSYAFGDKIDYTQSFALWMQDNSTADTRYTKTEIDMNLSEAKISNWQGVTPGGVPYNYKLTVMDGATLGDKEVVQTDGVNLATIQASDDDVAAALDLALAAQTLTVNNGPSGTAVIEIKDVGGDAQRSAASIAEALSAIDGVDAYASELSAEFDLSGILAAEEGDAVQFSLYVDGQVFDQSFIVDLEQGDLADQFENALRDAVEAINDIKADQDLFSNGLNITSSSGRTLGIQDFEVLDNAGVRMDNFSNFTAGDTFTISSTSTADISITLPPDIATYDDAQVAAAFYDAVSLALEDEPFSVVHDSSNNSIIVRTTDGSDLVVGNGDNPAGAGAGFDITGLDSTIPTTTTTIPFNGAGTTETYAADTQTGDTLRFTGQGDEAVIVEKSGAGIGSVAAGVIVGTVTIVMEPGMAIHSDVTGPGGLFDGNRAKSGSSIITLGGGEDGFSTFTPGATISFFVDSIPINYVVAGATDLLKSTQLASVLDTELGADYEILHTGTSVSILKSVLSDEPIEITDFTESGITGASLAVSTGTGSGTSAPENDLLQAGNDYRNFATSSLFADEGIIKWEKYNADGFFTGDEGLITLKEEGNFSIVESDSETLSFDISKGSLVAGNVLTINTDEDGGPDPLDFRVAGAANNKNEIYKFTVTTGGKIGELVDDEDDTLTIEWKTSTSSGFFELEGSDPPRTPKVPIEIEVDGMTLNFYDGTLLNDDVFTLTTNESGIPFSTNADGKPTGELLSDWHWTIDSFADQFNRQTEGMKASTTIDHELKFEASEDYYAVTDVAYSGSNGFNENNVSLLVTDWSAIDFGADDLQLFRSLSGGWGLVNDPTGGRAALIPEGGDDDGFGIDFSGDGLADIQVSFAKKVSGQGFVQLDFDKREKKDIGFAFSDDSATASSGLLAAAGINTFFKGYNAVTMDMNEKLIDTQYVAGARINAETGKISQGDNTNAIAMADVQYQDITMKQWRYSRGSGAASSLTTTTLDGYYSTMTGSMGIISRRIQSSRQFADTMVNNLTAQRNSVSAVSLDEEMIKLMQYQNAYSAASKLLTIADEMMETLINVI